MNVTMSQDDFKKLDSGELRSNHGLRDSSGHIKASLDISYISENELSQREAVRTETIYKESPVSSPTAQALTGATMEILGDILSDQKLKSPFLTLFTYSGTIRYNQKFKILLIESKASHNRNPLALNKFFKQKQNKFYLHKLLFRIQKILHLSLFLSQMNRLHFC